MCCPSEIPVRFAYENALVVNPQVFKRENDWGHGSESDDDEHDQRPRIAVIGRVPDADALLYKQRWVGTVNIIIFFPAAVRRALFATRQYRHEQRHPYEQSDRCENKQD